MEQHDDDDGSEGRSRGKDVCVCARISGKLTLRHLYECGSLSFGMMTNGRTKRKVTRFYGENN